MNVINFNSLNFIISNKENSLDYDDYYQTNIPHDSNLKLKSIKFPEYNHHKTIIRFNYLLHGVDKWTHGVLRVSMNNKVIYEKYPNKWDFEDSFN